jgi:hypothetical protein
MSSLRNLGLFLALVSLFGCANELTRSQNLQPITAKEQDEQQQKGMPTITYRPG